MSGRCKERVWNGQFSDYPCSRKDWKDGYCKQHHPDSVKKRRDDAYARFTAKMVAVADTMYQAKVAEEAALQDQQRRQSEENVQLRLENERLREALEIIAGYRQCVDPLMGNQDIAIAALAQK